MIKMQTFLRNGDQQIDEYEEDPVSEAKVFEVVDYAAYFCGPQCYSKWATQDENPECQRPKDKRQKTKD